MILGVGEGRAGDAGGRTCEVCGAAAPDATRVPLAARYLDAEGDELDVDVVVCGEEHARTWIAEHRPVEVARDARPAWRDGPSPAPDSPSSAGCVALLLVLMALIVLAGFVIGRLRGGG
jgi:hypothetical protein